MPKKYFFLKLNPPRPTFTVDMTDDERKIMNDHVKYWQPYVKDGTVLVLGPVLKPEGGFGIAIIGVEDEKRIDELISIDPANGLNSYEVYPMRVVSKWIEN
jgi:uncharacterized protein YciI